MFHGYFEGNLSIHHSRGSDLLYATRMRSNMDSFLQDDLLIGQLKESNNFNFTILEFYLVGTVEDVKQGARDIRLG